MPRDHHLEDSTTRYSGKELLLRHGVLRPMWQHKVKTTVNLESLLAIIVGP